MLGAGHTNKQPPEAAAGPAQRPACWYNPVVKCPHCLENFHDNPQGVYLGNDDEGGWFIVMHPCPACRKMSLHLQRAQHAYHGTTRMVQKWDYVHKETLVRPKGSSRPPCPPEVHTNIAGDYVEACNVLADSPKASAALGRRCLQTLLRETVKVKSTNLSDEIQQVLDSGKLPSGLHDSIDAIRNIGNFAAHPINSQQTGLIFEVAPGEAEWTLDVLEELFDFYFVLPALIQKKKDDFNKKLQEAGKPPMK